MHAQLNAPRCLARHPQMLDAIAQRFGIIDICRRQLGNSFGISLVKLQRNTERNGSQNRQLVCGINAFHVKRRVSFGVAQCLGFFQHIGKSPTFFTHLGQDKITGAINDAGQPVDTVASQTFTNGLDHRNTTSYSSFVTDHHALGARFGKDLITMHCQKSLVGSHNMFAVLDCSQHQFASYRLATNQFYHHINIRIGSYRHGIVGYSNTGSIALWIDAARSNLYHFDPPANAPGNFARITLQYI